MKALLLTALLLAGGSVTAASADDGTTTNKNYKPVALDLAVPESPAAAALSGNYETVLKPTTAREFTSSLLTLREKDGGVAPGVSIEVTPSFFTSRNSLPDDYARNPALRIGLNTQVSIATGSKDEATGKVQKVAGGLRVPVYDEGDVRWDPHGIFGRCTRKIAAPVPPIPTQPGETSRPLDAGDLKVIEHCKKAFRHASWNAQALVFGAAQIWADGASGERKLKRDASYYWLSYARPFGGVVVIDREEENKIFDIWTRPGQVIIQARHIRSALADGEEVEANRRFDSNALALRLRYGSENFNLSLAGSAERRNYDAGKRENVRIVSGGFERRLAKDFWIRLSVGNERRGGSGEPFVSMNVAWSKENEPTFAIPPLR